MVRVPKKVSDRLSKQIGVFQRVLARAKDRDVNESDTVTIITDMLASVFGFDKYSEVTSEQAIRGTYCDLAVKIKGTFKYLIEVKAIGLTLKENHLRQAMNYGANQGIPWVVLTNGVDWEIYKIRFERPIGCDLICACNFLELTARNKEDHKKLYLLCKEGLSKAVIEQYHEHVQSVNRFMIGQVALTDPVVGAIRRELRRLNPDVKVSKEEIAAILQSEVLKREIVDGEPAEEARKRVRKAGKAVLRKKAKKAAKQESESASPPADVGEE